MTKASSFYREAKEFQVLRFINTISTDAVVRRSSDGTKAVEDQFIKKMKASRELNHYLDLVLKVESWHQLYYTDPARRFLSTEPSGPKWKYFYPDDEDAIMHPLFIIFTSSLNESTDGKLREQLVEEGDEGVNLEPLSFYIYGNTVFLGNKQLDELNTSIVALLLFQSRNSTSLANIRDPAALFRIPPGPRIDTPSGWKVNLVGLLRGEIDGFMMLSCSKNEEPETLKKDLLEFLAKNSGQSYVFFGSIAPLMIYFCRFEERVLHNPDNLDLLSVNRVKSKSRKVVASR